MNRRKVWAGITVAIVVCGIFLIPSNVEHVSAYDIQTKNTAIEKGLSYLAKHQSSAGSWDGSVGITSLADLAFLNYGYNENNNQTVRNATKYIVSKVHGNGAIYVDSSHITYETSIAILALVATRNESYKSIINNATNWLVSSQWDEDCLWGHCYNNKSNSSNYYYYGGFGYGYHVRPDLSNGQWALMALDAADLPKSNDTWKKAQVFLNRTQNNATWNDMDYAKNTYSESYDDGGFVYTADGGSCAGGTISYGSMTGAGIWGLILSGLPTIDPRVVAALKWVNNHYDWDVNPEMGSSGFYYYYVSMAKALTLCGKTKIVDENGISHIWYEEMADEIISRQYADGYWVNSNSWANENYKNLVTAYSLLALETQTLPPGAKSSMSIILHSCADLHVYDNQGRHVGKNYDTNQIETEIPNATFETEPDGSQNITLLNAQLGDYRVVLVGTSAGAYELTVTNYLEGIEESSAKVNGTITPEEALGTKITYCVVVGPEVMIEPPKLLPTLQISPSSMNIVCRPGDTVYKNITLREIGLKESIHLCSISGEDLIDRKSKTAIPNSSVYFSFDQNNFDLSVGEIKTILVTLSIPLTTPESRYESSILIETLDLGPSRINLDISAMMYAAKIECANTSIIMNPIESLSHSFIINVTNMGYASSDTINISAQNLSGGVYVRIDMRFVELSSGLVNSLTVTVSLSPDIKAGNYSFSLIARSQNTTDPYNYETLAFTVKVTQDGPGTPPEPFPWALLISIIIILVICAIVGRYGVKIIRKRIAARPKIKFIPSEQPPVQPYQPQPLPQYPCPFCGQPLRFIQEYQRWCCDTCKRYV